MNHYTWNNYGESSLTLLAVHCGIDKEQPAVPLDQSDFRRCIHLFDCLALNGDACHDLIKKTSEIYPIWKPIYDNWTKLLGLYFGLDTTTFHKTLSDINRSAK